MKTVIVTKDKEKGQLYAISRGLDAFETWVDSDDKKAKQMGAEIIYLDEYEK